MAYREDYARGGFPMLPVVRGETAARKHVLYYLGATLVAAGALALASPLGVLYALTTAVLGAVFLVAVVSLHYEQTEGAAMRAFHASNAFLGGLLLAVLLDASVV
jgi:protoheme IX farnesyltransferase